MTWQSRERFAAAGRHHRTAGTGESWRDAADQSVSTSASNGSAAPAIPAPSPTPLPAIVIAGPAGGSTVTARTTFTGTADTFEATFRLQLRDRAGHLLLDQQVHATSGTGTRGTFDSTVTTSFMGSGTLVAFEVSAKDGSQINTVTVPVTVG